MIIFSSTLLFLYKFFIIVDCIHTKDVPDDVFDLYCWIHSTYTIPRALSLHVGTEVAHPGVMASNVGEEEERRYVSYYQWVGFCLFFQVCNRFIVTIVFIFFICINISYYNSKFFTNCLIIFI